MTERIGPGGARAADSAHCADLVRAEDPERATAVLFARPDRRASLHALYAFDLETSNIRDRVRQPIAGEIRLQWWRDTIAAGGEGQGSPVAAALLGAIRAHALPLDAFERLLDARIFDLYEDPMPSREAFEAYAGETASTILMLAAMILDRDRAASVSDLAGHAGVALAAARTLAEEDKLVARGQVYVPADLLVATGLTRTSYLDGEGDRGAARDAMLAFARHHLAVVEGGWAKVPSALRPAFLPAYRLGARLDRMERGRPPARSGALGRSFAYWRAMRVKAARA